MHVNLTPAAQRLDGLLRGSDLPAMPCCFDALSARLVERSGFPLTFMSGFAVAAVRLALPDTVLVSYSEMLDQGRGICEAVSIPVIGDGDTGYGNPANVRRTVVGYARAGFAGVMIEDQVAPKRCGHTRGKEGVGRAEALARLRAALDARDEEAGICIVARTDARASLGLEEAIWRMQAFADLGADVVFLEAPRSEAEMAAFGAQVPGVRMANMLEEGDTPILPPERLAALGYRIVAYPLTLLNSAVYAMQRALDDLKVGRTPSGRVDFATIRDLVGFAGYDETLKRYDAGSAAELAPGRTREPGS